MRFISCFSGLEGASLAFGPFGWECAGVAEIEPFPCEIIKQRFPHVINLGSVLADDFLDRVAALAPDAVVGGPPCQDFSIAGLRRGLDGDRGNLTLRWVQIIHAARSKLRFALTENVPGWLSVSEGHAFGSFLAALVGADSALIPPIQCGGRWTDAGMVDGPEGRAAWRILDAQFFGLAQRRERVFVVFCPRDGADPSEILFERSRGGRNSAPRRETREGTAGAAAPRAGSGSEFAFGGGNRSGPIEQAATLTAKGQRCDFEVETFVIDPIPFDPRQIHHPANFSNPKPGDPSHPLRAVANCEPAIAFTSKDYGGDASADLSPTLVSNGDAHSGYRDEHGLVPVAIAFDARQVDVHGDIMGTMRANGGSADVPAVAFDMRGREGGSQFEGPHDTANIRAASGGSSRSYVAERWAVRRLTPTECERLQGVPDGHTLIPWRGKPADLCPDGPRYKALGNSWAVPVVHWIARRLTAALELA